jgi:CRISPR-associated endoribonuclease Cas6
MTNLLYSIILELSATSTTTIPASTGYQAHALFLDLIRQVDPALSSRLHDEPEYRPFTVSMLSGANTRDGKAFLQAGQTYRLRITLLDGGHLWQCLSTHFLEARSITLYLDKAEFQLARVLSTPAADATDWASYTDWQTLASTAPRRSITIRFASPCAFSMGDRRFALFPEPMLVWDSLMRTWNRYAPEVLRIDKLAMRDFVTHHIVISDYELHTTCLHFPKYAQKGFVGSCSYMVKTDDGNASQVAALAEFARYAGVGYKTTMGMGQARIEESDGVVRYGG